MTDEWQEAEQAAGSARETLDQIETILKANVQEEERTGEVLLALAFGLGTFALPDAVRAARRRRRGHG